MTDERRPRREKAGNGGHRRSGRRGQSEVIGYVAVFTIVILLVSIAVTTGYGQLREVRSFEQANSATRTVEQFAAEVEALLRDDARQRSVGIELGDGSLSRGEPVTVNVSGHAVGNASQNFSQSFELQTLVFEVGDTRIRYVAGAVVRVDEGAVMVREPPGVFSQNQTVYPVVDAPLEDSGIGGRSRVVLTATRPTNGTELVRSTSEPYNVTVSIDTPQADVWQRYLEAELNTTCNQTGTSVSCSYKTKRLSVVAYRIVVTHDV